MRRRLGGVFYALMLAAGPLVAQQVAYEGSASASTGRYFFTERTTSVVVTNGVSLRAGPLTLRGSLPVWWQNTTLITATGAGPLPGGGPAGREAVRDSGQARDGRGRIGVRQSALSPAPHFAVAGAGRPADPTVPAPPEALASSGIVIADPSFGATVRVVSGRRVSVSVGTTVKAPIGDSTVTTGEWDVGASASMTVLLGPRLTGGLDASYWHLGDMADFDFRDPVMGSASLGILLGSRWAGIASVTGGTSALRGYDAPFWVAAGVSRSGTGGSAGLHVSVGLSESAPDVSAALVWTVQVR